MSHKKLLRLLAARDLPAVLVGDLAMRILGAPHTGRAMDLAVRSLDVEEIVLLLYENGYAAVTSAGSTRAHVLRTATAATDWIEERRASAVTLVRPGKVEGLGDIPLSQIDIATQVDLLFDLPVPVMRLKKRARAVVMDDVTILVASPRDLLELKRRRPRKTRDDLADIAHLERILASA